MTHFNSYNISLILQPHKEMMKWIIIPSFILFHIILDLIDPNSIHSTPPRQTHKHS